MLKFQFANTRSALGRLTAAGAIGAAAMLAIACDQNAAAPAQPSQPAAAASPAAAPESAARIPRFGSGEARPKHPGSIRLVSYNVENLFDDHDDPDLSGRHEDQDRTKPEPHLQALAATIRTLDPDILALQEIESERALLWFRDAYLADMGYVHLASPDAGDDRGIEQSVLSRYPIVEMQNWPRLPLGGEHPEKWGNAENFNAGLPITFRRSPLLATIEVPASASGEEGADSPYRLTLFVVHKKSGGPGGYWREKEAAKAVELLREFQQQDPDRNIAVVGDFNARPEERPFTTYTAAGFIDAFGNRTSSDPSSITHESGRVIDFVLINPQLARELVPDSAFVFGTPARPEGSDWRTTPPPVGYVSDHYPLVVDIVPRDQ